MFQMAAIQKLFISLSKYRSFSTQPFFDHSKSRLGQISDPPLYFREELVRLLSNISHYALTWLLTFSARIHVRHQVVALVGRALGQRGVEDFAGQVAESGRLRY